MAMAAALVGPDPARVVDESVQGILEGLHTLADPASQQDDQKRTEGRQKVGASLTAASSHAPPRCRAGGCGACITMPRHDAPDRVLLSR